MRKPIGASTFQLRDIADSSHFKGILEDETGYFSDASLYEIDEETRDGLNDAHSDVYKVQPPSKAKKLSSVHELGAKYQSRVVKSFGKDSENYDKLSDEDKRVKSQKLSRNQRGYSIADSSDQRNSQSTSSEDVEAEWTKLISPNSISKAKDEVGKVQRKPEECSLDRSTQKRKRLCKAVELGLSSEKESRYKVKHAELKQRLQKISGIGRSKSTRTAVQGTVEVNGLKKHAQEGVIRHKEHNIFKDKDEAERSATTKLRHVLQKRHEMKYEDGATSSSTKVQTVGTKGQSRVLQDGNVKGVKELCTSLETVHSVVEHNRHIDKDGDNGIVGEEVSSGVTEGVQKKLLVINEKGTEKDSDLDVAWVLCDSCRKWRCIPSQLAEHIEATNCGWSCKENPNKKFADCSVPQEKTNAEINAELDLSEHSTCEEGDRKDHVVDSKTSSELHGHSRPGTVWTLIKHNMFHHRRRKSETIDEQPVCNCTPPRDGGIGCGDDCLNRIMNVECNAQSCPCGDLCSNQQFQKRLYTKVGLFRCGKKGFGLQVMEDVSTGTFIIEYVGEVLDMAAYEARQKEYAFGGQKHFYFMTLNNSEVIDACAKGNLGRFINHSCEPNCRTEKWVVNGEVCIGIFAIRDIKKGEEITFDYNFVRVCGAAAKKCLCGSRECRGFIGGDPMTPPSIVDSDSSEDDPEPLMIEEKSESSYMDGCKRQEEAHLCASIEQSDIGKNSEEKVELEELVDENGGLCKVRYDAQKTAEKYLKLLYHAFVSKGAFESKGEALRRTRDVSMVLDALLKTQSQSILTGIVNEDGLKKFNEYMIMTRKDYRETPIVRKLLRVLEHLAANRIVTIEQISSDLGPESLSDTILHLCRHADVEVQQIAHRFKDKWLNIPYSVYRRFDEDIRRKDKQSSKWVQPSEEVLDATLSSGLPQSFWPFAANYLPENQHHNEDQHLRIQETDSAATDALAATHPGPHSFPSSVQHPASVVPAVPGVVNGIPFEHLIPDSAIGYITQDESVCVGIPIAQLHAALAEAQECTHFPEGFSSGSHLHDGNADGKVLPSNCRSTMPQENMPDEMADMSDLDFGVLPSKFFKQLYNSFGPTIHPWQLQVLMAAHAWGPHLSGDARIKDLKEPGLKCWTSEFSSGVSDVDMVEQPSGAPGYDFEPDLPVSGSSPAMPPRLSGNLSRRQYFGNEHMGRSNPHYQQYNSGPPRMHRWKPQRWSKFPGHRHGNQGFRRDFSFNRRNSQQGYPRQGSSRFHNRWEGSFHRRRMNSNSFSEHENVIMDGDGDGASYFSACMDPVDDLEKPMALERPWGYAQGQFAGDANHSEHNQEECFQMGMEM